MSLLTEKQITEIIDIANHYTGFAEILKLKLDHWNSNQTAQIDAVLKLKELRDIQGKKGNYDYDEYMRGLYNGLELALSLMEGEREPQYKNQPEPPITSREMYQRGYAAGVRFAEKAHGIGVVE